MKLILNDGTELNPIVVNGFPQYVQNQNRDTIEFAFDGNASMVELDKLFTESNCEKLTIIDDNGDGYIHNGYTIRVSINKKTVEVAKGTLEGDSVYEQRVYVTMAQRTYTETQLSSLVKSQADQDEIIAELMFGGDM